MGKILTESVEVKIWTSNINHFRKIGYNCELRDVIKVNPTELNIGSKAKIKLQCTCNAIYEMKFNEYIRYNNDLDLGEFKCKNCKRVETVKRKYNVENVFQNEKIKTKIKNTLKEKYNVDNISKLEENKEIVGKKISEKSKVSNEKRVNTVQEKYNVDNISQLEFVKNKKKDKWERLNSLEKELINNKRSFSIIEKNKDDEYREKFKMCNDNENKYLKYLGDKTHLFQCKLGHEFEMNTDTYWGRKRLNSNVCNICNPRFESSGQQEVVNYIKSFYKGEIVINSRKIINPLEIDIFIPEFNIAFEYNGIFWHSDKFKSNDYHFNKWLKCKMLNIKLFQIWEDEWLSFNSNIKFWIKNKFEKKISNFKCVGNNIMVGNNIIGSVKNNIIHTNYNLNFERILNDKMFIINNDKHFVIGKELKPIKYLKRNLIIYNSGLSVLKN